MYFAQLLFISANNVGYGVIDYFLGTPKEVSCEEQ